MAQLSHGSQERCGLKKKKNDRAFNHLRSASTWLTFKITCSVSSKEVFEAIIFDINFCDTSLARSRHLVSKTKRDYGKRRDRSGEVKKRERFGSVACTV